MEEESNKLFNQRQRGSFPEAVPDASWTGVEYAGHSLPWLVAANHVSGEYKA